MQVGEECKHREKDYKGRRLFWTRFGSLAQDAEGRATSCAADERPTQPLAARGPVR
jgi:hypothetical protein